MAAPKPHFAYSLTPLALAGLGWDMGMLILILYNVFAVPVSICFDLEVPPTHPWFWFDLVFDIVFLTDCFLVNFNTAVMTEAGHLVREAGVHPKTKPLKSLIINISQEALIQKQLRGK